MIAGRPHRLVPWLGIQSSISLAISKKSEKYYSQMDRVKAAIDDKLLELANRKSVLIIWRTPDLTSLCRNGYHLDGISYYTNCTQLTFELPFFWFLQNYLSRKKILWKPVKSTSTNSSPEEMPSSGNMESWSCFKGAEIIRTK